MQLEKGKAQHGMIGVFKDIIRKEGCVRMPSALTAVLLGCTRASSRRS